MSARRRRGRRRRRPARARRSRKRCAAPRCAIARSRRRGTCRRPRAGPSCPRRLNLAASLPIVVVLPEPLTPTTRITNGFLRRIDRERPGDRLERALDLGGENRLHLVRTDPALVAPAADRLANARRRGEAEVGLDEDVLEIVERGGVELALGEDVGDAARRSSTTSARGRRAGAEASFASGRRRRGRGGGRRRFSQRRRDRVGSGASRPRRGSAGAVAGSPRRTSGAAGRSSPFFVVLVQRRKPPRGRAYARAARSGIPTVSP